jgi:penicillin-binding protein 1C
MVFFIISLALISLIITSYAYALPSFQEVKDSYQKSDAVLLDRHGKVIHELRVNPAFRRLDWVRLEEVSPALINAVIRSEDKRFFEHHGVDWMAVGSAMIKNLFSRQSRGASTITMQLVSMIADGPRPAGKKRTVKQKWYQIQAAKDLEETWSKKEILEAYLNLLTFRGELQGISAGSRGLFNKEPSGLNEPESFLLSSLIRAPNASPAEVGRRACLLGKSMNSMSACEDIERLAETIPGRGYIIKQRIAIAPHVAYRLLTSAEQSSFSKEGKELLSAIRKKDISAPAHSTLDAELQRFASDVLRQHIYSVKLQNVNDGAVLVVDNAGGEVLAYVGNSGNESSARYVDGIRAKRQAGSTLKPFLYALAFEKQILTPASILSDSPFDISTALGIYKPENYESDFKGLVSVRTALASSLNIPAVRTLGLTGVEPFIQRLKLLGFSQLKDDDYYGFSVALGSADVSLWELVNAYRTLANHGVWSGLHMTSEDRGEGNLRIFSEEVAFLVSSILSDREARSETFSLENPLSTRYWSAVKTGTSKDMRDNWCIGYSERYTVGVWIGNFSGAAMWNVSGITGAAPVWLEVMNYLHRDSPGLPPRPPSGVLAKGIAFQDAVEAERTEWFIQETEPADAVSGKTVISYNAEQRFPHILYPPDGTVIALDPDVPTGNHSVFFEAKADGSNVNWILNGKCITPTFNAVVPWIPEQGKYLLSLVDNQGHILDSVSFEVRGSLHAQE